MEVTNLVTQRPAYDPSETLLVATADLENTSFLLRPEDLTLAWVVLSPDGGLYLHATGTFLPYSGVETTQADTIEYPCSPENPLLLLLDEQEERPHAEMRWMLRLADLPGAIADLTNCLAEAGIDIHSMYILARDEPLIEMGLTVDNPKKAKRVLADR